MISARRFLVVAIGFALTVATAAQRSAPNEPRLQHRPDIPAVNGLVTAGHPLAAAAGVRVLMQGGNAFDASVATLAVLNVVRPQMSGAAGNGFFTIYDAASAGIHSLNATGAAPLGFDPAQVEASDPLERHQGRGRPWTLWRMGRPARPVWHDDASPDYARTVGRS